MTVARFHAYRMCWTEIDQINTTYLDSKATAVNVVAKEQIVSLRELASDFERFHEVVLQGLNRVP